MNFSLTRNRRGKKRVVSTSVKNSINSVWDNIF